SANCADWRDPRMPGWLRVVLLGIDTGVSAEHRWKAAQQLAGVHTRDFRMHDIACSIVSRVWDACVEWPAAALSPGLQRRGLRRGHAQPVLFVHRGKG